MTTRIKCNYVFNPHEVREEKAEPLYCRFRGKDGFCSLEEIEMTEHGSGFCAQCWHLEVKLRDGSVYK